jgi:hypothetical protein
MVQSGMQTLSCVVLSGGLQSKDGPRCCMQAEWYMLSQAISPSSRWTRHLSTGEPELERLNYQSEEIYTREAECDK